PFIRSASREADMSPASASPAEPGSTEEAGENLETTFFVAEDESSGQHLSSAELAELYRRIAELRAQHRQGGKKVQRRRDQRAVFDLRAGATESEQEEEESETQKMTTARRRHAATGLRYFYDEWDYVIEDYRTQWCQLREFPLHGDAGGFFDGTLTAYADLLPDIKREFQRLRPRLYHKVKGLEDGEEIDLEAAVAARVDLRTGISPSAKLYAARQALERDVAALFLLDMSASTETLLAEREGVRIIDVMKEAIVLLSTALEDIGDTYAIYGFSSHGRRNVEVYPVKTFVETLSPEVKGRIGALSPQRSTRMGAAVRHATRKLKELSCRAKLLVLLSDGFPEDTDYGQDKHTPMYGLRDTMMALREAEKSGILSFCLTVDKGGHDYLREMCAPSRYMVIEDMTALPAELPKIYQRHIRSREV
ncbi:MAG: nitric oxide reductase activation protein NorD, partial [Candidatus Binatia bacterium]